MSQKMKAKPPPINLKGGEVPSPSTTHSVPRAKPSVTDEEHQLEEVYHHYEDTLMNLLSEDELMPLNLHTAASLGVTASVRQLIERCGVDVNSRNSGDWTAIMYSSLFSHDETTLYLLEMKADVNQRNPNGKTPLMLAALCGSEDTIRLLLQHGALLEERDNDQFTALMLAIQATHCESALLLLEHGANASAREAIHGQTPLYIAAQTGQLAVARALVARNVDVDVRTSSGDTAYHVALRNGYSAIASLIMEASGPTTATPPAGPMLLVDGCEDHIAMATEASNHLAPAPSRYKPKSPYSAFFDGYPAPVPHLRVEAAEDVPPGVGRWFGDAGDTDVTRRSPDGALEASPTLRTDAINPFHAWPGTSMIFKQAFTLQPPPPHHHRLHPEWLDEPERHFKRSVTKPGKASTTSTASAWAAPGNDALDPHWCKQQQQHRHHQHHQQQQEQQHRQQQQRPRASAPLKLPKDLSSLLAELGLTKYQMHFEEQDIDLQVFLTMNETDLREIGINSLGARRKCLSAIEYYQTLGAHHYGLGDEFLINTLVNKAELQDLRQTSQQISALVDRLRRLLPQAPPATLVDQLSAHLVRQRQFFIKY